MKKYLLKVLSAMLCIVILLSTLPFASFAVTANGTCGENVSWSFDESTGILTIEGTGDMQDYNHLYINKSEYNPHILNSFPSLQTQN